MLAEKIFFKNDFSSSIIIVKKKKSCEIIFFKDSPAILIIASYRKVKKNIEEIKSVITKNKIIKYKKIKEEIVTRQTARSDIKKNNFLLLIF